MSEWRSPRMGLTTQQLFGIAIAIFSVLAVSTANLADLFGPAFAKAVSSASNILNAILAGVLTTISGEAKLLQNASNIKGVRPIEVTGEASPSIAALAINPDVSNVYASRTNIAEVKENAESEGH